jgi:adenylate cyclase
MLAIFPLLRETQTDACRNALDAAREAIRTMERVNRLRSDAGKPAAHVDLALHIGEVLYGNVGAADRLDFTVIGPAVNEAARIETLCEPLGRNVLVSAEFAEAIGSFEGLQSLGHHRLRGVREPRAIYGLEL